MPSVKKFVVLFLLLFCGQIFAVPTAEVEYFYSQDGTLIGRAVNGKRLNYEYDLKGQLLAVKDTSGKVIEQYVYDPAGNILSKTIENKTTTFTYDEANQLVSSTYEGKTTTYEYDAAGRLVREGSKIYSYGYLDKILEVQENGKQVAAFDYHVDGQIASATYSDKSESFIWDGLALIQRNENTFINEPHVTGGNPILSSKDGVMFNDMLGNTLSVNGKTVDMTAFGATSNPDAMFTGKPYIGELGYAFLFRNYRADNGKWQTADPLGYPDGWNQLAYCNNEVTIDIDWLGACSWFGTCDVKRTLTKEVYGNEQTIKELQVACSSGVGAHYESDVKMTLGIVGDIKIWGLSIPINISWEWSPSTLEIPAYVCESKTHAANAGRKHVQFYVVAAARIKYTEYECGETSQEILSRWEVIGHRVTVLSQCE